MGRKNNEAAMMAGRSVDSEIEEKDRVESGHKNY